MQIAVRSTLTAGVALMGAGVIAVTPIAPSTTPDLHLPALHSSAVQLAAQTNPITQWEQIIAKSAQNTERIVTGVLADPIPVLGQVVKNQIASVGTLAGALGDYVSQVGHYLANTPALLKEFFQQLATGQFAEGLQSLVGNTIGAFVAPLMYGTVFPYSTVVPKIQSVLAKPVQSLLNVINYAAVAPDGPGWFTSVAFPLMMVPGDFVAAATNGLQNVFNAVRAGKLGAALGAIVAIPGAIVDAVLNGYNGQGLLGEYGVIQGFRNALKIIATAITPSVASPVAASKSAASPTVTPVADLATPGAVTLKVPSAAAKAAAAAADEDSAAVVAPVTKQDRRARGSHAKSASEDGAASVAAGGETTKGSDDGASTHKSGSSSKRNHQRANKGASAASDSGSAARSSGHARGAGAGAHRTAKAGGA